MPCWASGCWRREIPELSAVHNCGSGHRQVPDVTYDLVAKNQGFLRALPLWAGGLSIVALLANRAVSGVRTPPPCTACCTLCSSSMLWPRMHRCRPGCARAARHAQAHPLSAPP